MLSADDEIQSERTVSGATQWQAAIQPAFAASVLAIAHAHCTAGVPTSVAHPHPWLERSAAQSDGQGTALRARGQWAPALPTPHRFRVAGPGGTERSTADPQELSKTTPEEVVERILGLRLQQPAWGWLRVGFRCVMSLVINVMAPFLPWRKPGGGLAHLLNICSS
jgi:hypothetical protein